MGGKFAALSLIDIAMNELTSGFNEAVRSTATQNLGKQRKKKQITNDIPDLCDKRRELKKDKYNSQDAAEQYKITNKNVRSKMKEAKERWDSREMRGNRERYDAR